MTEQDRDELLCALGEELCGALSPPLEFSAICPQDGIDVCSRVLGDDITPRVLASLTEDDLEYQLDSVKNHFKAINPELTIEMVVVAFQKYASHEESWISDFEWTHVPIE